MGMIIWVLLLIGIFVWPEATLCVVLWQAGYPLLAILAIFATFFNGRDIVKKKYNEYKGN